MEHIWIAQVHLEVEAADVGVDRGLILWQLECKPLMAGEHHEQPALLRVADDDLVVGTSPIVLDKFAYQLNAFAGRFALTEDDAGVVVLADARVGVQRIPALNLYLLPVLRSLIPFPIAAAHNATLRINAQCSRTGDAPLVNTGGRIGVGDVGVYPIGDVIGPVVAVIAHVRVPVGRRGGRPLEARLLGMVFKPGIVRRLDAEDLHTPVPAVFGAPEVPRALFRRERVGHPHLCTREGL